MFGSQFNLDNCMKLLIQELFRKNQCIGVQLVLMQMKLDIYIRNIAINKQLLA